MEPDRMKKRYRKRRSTSSVFSEQYLKRLKRAIPHIIYPEILVIVDYDGYRLHGGDNTQVCYQNINVCIHLFYSVYTLHMNINFRLDQKILCIILEWS